MCGIAGIWIDTVVDRNTLVTFTRMLARRGPDGEGYRLEDQGRLGLGHTRLSVLDPSPAGLQPMSYLDGRYWIVFNGEIYNFLEIRRDLEKRGYRFRSDTDTEVILAAYDHEGPACLSRFNGMWAFAIWDRRERTLFLSRDRFGVKPLFVASSARRFAFASEQKAFLRLDDIELSERPLPGALFRDVTLLPAGSSLLLRDPGDRPVHHRWWRLLDHVVERAPSSSLGEHAECLRGLLTDACRLRMRTDIPLASSISGGIDSSSVLATVAELGHGSRSIERLPSSWQRAYFAWAPGTRSDERRYADAAIAAARAEPRIFDVKSVSLSSDIERYLFETEGRRVQNVWIWMLYRFMRNDGVTVTLDGQGGDEVFGGYEQTILSSLFLSGDLLRTPRRALDLLATVSRMREPSLKRRLGEAILSDRWLLRAAGIVPRLRRWLDGLKSEWKTVDKVDPEALSRLGPLRALLLGYWIEEELPMLLQTFDLFSMAHGVEVRMPLLDWRLVTYVLSLPDASLVSDGWTKRVLREAMRGRVPNAILGRRDKQGFSGPLRPWVQHGQLRDFVVHHAQQAEFLADDPAEARRVRGIVDGWCRGDARMGLWDERDVGVAVSETWVATSWARHGRSIRLSDAPPRMVPG